MTSSSTIIYAALLLIVLLTPYASLFLSRRGGDQLVNRIICACLLIGAILLTVARQGAFPMIGVFVLLPLIGRGMPSLLGGTTAALLFATTLWWPSSLQFGPVPTAISALLAIGAGFLPRWKGSSIADQSRLLPSFLLCVVVGIAAGLLTAPFESTDAIYAAWHHWGAYLAPVEAWRGGGVPYRDFPIQYGLGPTLLLMANCGQDCWRGMYETAIVANAFYFATLSGCVIILTARSPKGVRWLALIAMFCAAFFWTGFPSNFAGPAMTPSVAGLRFLSISALLLHILYAEQTKIRRDWIGHAIWLIDLFWSPEAAFFGTIIWWPYLALRDAGTAKGWRAAFIILARGGLRGAVALAIGACALATMLWLLSAWAITVLDFFAYIQHPPGVLPIDPMGAIWIALAILMLAVIMLSRQGLTDRARPFYACLLALLAAGSYFLSRSHDNNILNLFPLLILVLLSTLNNLNEADPLSRDFNRTFIHTMLVAMIAFIPAFDYGAWQEGSAKVGPMHLGPSRLISRFTPKIGDTPAILPADAVAALQYLRGRNAGAVAIFDRNYLMPRSSGPAWTGVNNLANFAPLPDAMAQHYIQRGAVSYGRSGWLLLNTENRHWLDSFKTAYDVREQKSFGDYTAYLMMPRMPLRVD